MSAHVVPPRTYLGIFAALLVLTAITIWVAFQDLGIMNNVVAMGIAALKATLVVLYFMHVRYSTRLTQIMVASSLVWLVILIAFTLSDVYTRGLLGVPGK
jgi:cytochrome c oxidase subunit 4